MLGTQLCQRAGSSGGTVSAKHCFLPYGMISMSYIQCRVV